MGQDEVLQCLEKQKEPISRSEIAKELGCEPISVSHAIKKLLNKEEIKCIELDRVQAGLKLGMDRPFRRMRFYYV